MEPRIDTDGHELFGYMHGKLCCDNRARGDDVSDRGLAPLCEYAERWHAMFLGRRK